MTRTRSFVAGWGPVIVWMALLFVASADPDSGARGSRILVPLIRWLVPDISPEALDRTVLLARKAIHFFSYGILAALVWRALARRWPAAAGSGSGNGDRWLRLAGPALAITVAYAVSDEIHQSYVPSRVGSIGDVGIDTIGAVTTLAVIGLVRRRTRRRVEHR